MFQKIDVSVDDVVGALRAAVEEKGAGYRYVNRDGETADGNVKCHYVHGAEPGCIVGNVAHRLGVPLSELGNYENRSAYDVVPALFDAGDGTGNDDVAWMLTYAQGTQDEGSTWGDALGAAEGYLADARAQRAA